MTLLETVKSLDNRTALMIFMKDDQAKKILSAWTFYRPKCSDRDVKNYADLPGDLHDLWLEIGQIDYERLSDISGIPLMATITIFNRLMNAHLVFPDGTLAKSARNLIISEVGSYVGGLTKGLFPMAEKPKEPLASPKKKFVFKRKTKKVRRKRD